MALLWHMKYLWKEPNQIPFLQQFTLFLLIVAFLATFYIMLISYCKGGKSRLPPTPPRLPMIGNLHQLGKLPHRSLHILSKNYGPVMFMQLGHRPTVVISSHEIVQEVFRTNDVTFSNKPKSIAGRILFYDSKDMGFQSFGEHWRYARNICVRQLLTPQNLRSFHFVIEEEVSMLLDKLHHASLDNVQVNLSQMLLVVSNNIASRFVIGNRIGFGELARKMMTHLGEFSFGDYFPYLGWMDICTGLIRRIKGTARTMDALLDQAIEVHKEVIYDDNDPQPKDFTDILLLLQRDVHLAQDSLKAILLDMYVAATDTTASLMEWTMTELIRNPIAMGKVQEEVRREVGRKLKVEESDISRMKYLQCVMKETLRLHPPAPLLTPRETSANVNLGGYEIPSKTRVIINAWAIQRDPKVWYKAEEFFPDRFEDNRVDFKRQDFQFIPFGGGRRRCPGIYFGMKIVEYVLANLLYGFDWKLPSQLDGEIFDTSETFGVVVTKKVPIYVVPCLYSP